MRSIANGRSGITCFMLAVPALLSAACGGGGSGGTASQNPQFAARQAWQALVAGNRTFTVSGRGFNYETFTENDLFEWTYSFSSPLAASSPIDGTPQLRLQLTSEMRAASAGNAVVQGTPLDTYLDAGQRILGHSSINGCSIVATSTLPPQTASLNDVGALAAAAGQPTCLGSPEPLVVYADRWSILSEMSTAFFCWSIDAYYVNTTTLFETAEFCFEITQGGSLGTKARVRYPSSPNSIVLRNY